MTALLVGSNLAVLIAADALAQMGVPVTFVTDGKRPGGHFYGFSQDGHDFDVGVVFLEWLETDGSKPPITGYDPSLRYDWTRFATAASEWVRSQAHCVKMPTPQTYVDGQSFPDHIFSNRLDLLASLNVPPPQVDKTNPAHPSRKREQGIYDTLTYAEAARLNHGAIHDRVIKPFMDKLLAGAGGDFLARHHRDVWAPLFYPETLAAALAGQEHGMREQPLWTVDGGFVGRITRQMLERLKKAPNVHLVDTPIKTLSCEAGDCTITLEDGQTIKAPRMALGLPPERAAALLGLSEPPSAQRLTLNILLALVKKDAIRAPRACMTIVDPDLKSYRLYDQDASAGADPDWHRVSLEANATLFDGMDAAETMRQEMQRLMDVENIEDIRIVKCLCARNVFPLPEEKTVHETQAYAREMHKKAPNALLTGALAGFGVATLNDQIVQGLQASAYLNGE